MHVQHIMSHNICFCKLDTTLDKVAIMMWDNDCGSVPIVDDKNRPVGIITDRDIAIGAALKHRPLCEITADEISNGRPIFTCKPDDDANDVLSMMKKEKIRRVPVVNNIAELCGMVSMGDIAAFSQQKRGAEISYKDTIATLKAVASHHDSHTAVATA